ncbi:hypothetical protein, partial [Escherichia coli]|uniref:hypothetical protein n=1 Tax=Escherichia coli TaxID=562 RepID=UPI003EE174F5
NCWRCIPQPAISMVVFWWKIAASSRIFAAPTPQIPVARIVEALENPGGAYQHNGMDRHFPDIRFIW